MDINFIVFVMSDRCEVYLSKNFYIHKIKHKIKRILGIMGVFNDNPAGKKPRLRLGYGTANRARKSVKLLKKQPHQYQVQATQTLYYRAKYHKHQTKGMRNAMKILGKFRKTLKNKHVKNII